MLEPNHGSLLRDSTGSSHVGADGQMLSQDAVRSRAGGAVLRSLEALPKCWRNACESATDSHGGQRGSPQVAVLKIEVEVLATLHADLRPCDVCQLKAGAHESVPVRQEQECSVQSFHCMSDSACQYVLSSHDWP